MLDQLLSSNPHWVVSTGVGVILGALMPFISRVIVFYFRKSRKTNLDGIWYCYHYTRTKEKVEIIESRWNISRSATSDFKIKTFDPVKEYKKYTGSITVDSGSAVVFLESHDGYSTSTFRIELPFPGHEQILSGVWVGVDFTNNIVASTCVLSRKSMSIDIATKIIESKFKITSQGKTIYVNNHIT